MADKEINDLTDGGYVADDDLVHVVRSGNSRKAKLRRQLPATPASSSGPASMEFHEDTDNGSNKVTLAAPSALGADRTATFPDKSGTLAMTDDIPAAASQSQMEAASLTDVNVTPGRLQFHPGVAKAWVVFDGSGTLSVGASHNVSSVADNGTGDYTVNFSTAFSSANYAAVNMGENDEGANRNNPGTMNSHTRSTSSHRIMTNNGEGAALDWDFVCLAYFGDQ